MGLERGYGKRGARVRDDRGQGTGPWGKGAGRWGKGTGR